MINKETSKLVTFEVDGGNVEDGGGISLRNVGICVQVRKSSYLFHEVVRRNVLRPGEHESHSTNLK